MTEGEGYTAATPTSGRRWICGVEMTLSSRRLLSPEPQSTLRHTLHSSLAPCPRWSVHSSSSPPTAMGSRDFIGDDDDEKRRRPLGQACMFEPNLLKISTVDSSADAAVDIYGDTMEMSSDDRFAVLRSIGEECIYEDELRLLLKKKPAPICYVWFEPSPWMDIEQGIMKTIYVNKMVRAGCTVKILMADWFLQRNHKIGCNLNKIRSIGYYNIEMWKAVGMDLERVEIVWLSDELNHHAVDYWPLAMDISRKYTMKKMARYCGNVSPYGPERLPAAEIFYPCLQVAAILCQKLQADMWLFSMDQRDIIMLARDYCEDIHRETKPTIMLHSILIQTFFFDVCSSFCFWWMHVFVLWCLDGGVRSSVSLPRSTDMLPNLLEDPEFQDVRDRGRTIFMQDEEDALSTKIMCAFCPPKVAICNPCLEYIKYVILPWFGKFKVVQKEGNGSNKTFASMEELVVDYESGALDSADVKLAFEKAINNILEPVRDYFSTNSEAQALITACKFQDHITADVRKIQLQNEEIDSP